MTKAELKEFLDAKVLEYNHPKFLEDDPIQIPHQFTLKEDIEISAFLTATIAWGNRKSIINNATKLMGLMGNTPYDFVMGHTEDDLDMLSPFVHRTFNGIDLGYFVTSLQNIYKNHGGLELVFSEHQNKDSMQPAITNFKELFFELPHQHRTQKHVSDPSKGSAAKRINMFLRWMVRDNSAGVDFGLWKNISPAKLSCPLDVHS
ncbi:MAG: TIGR02757 family protein, partial [Bacteroidota bacterium]|nr:TIGR02757 family protein [Bacteroidota bacterium]